MSRERSLLPVALLAALSAQAGAAAAAAFSISGDALVEQRGPQVRLSWNVAQCGSALRSEWRGEGGELLAWDEVEARGTELLSYRLERLNTGESYLAQRDGAGLRLRASRAGSTSWQSIPTARVLAGSQLVIYAQQHLAALRGGAALHVDYLIADHGRSIELVLRGENAAADGQVAVEIGASSMLLRPFVPTTTLRFAADGRFVGMSGQIPPQLGTARHPQALFARMTVRAAAPERAPALTSNCHIALSY